MLGLVVLISGPGMSDVVLSELMDKIGEVVRQYALVFISSFGKDTYPNCLSYTSHSFASLIK